MAATNHMHNLTTLIKRLEAATSRLEDIASSTDAPKDALDSNPPIASPPALTTVSTPPAAAAAAPPKLAVEPLPESVEEFDSFLNSAVDKYVKLSNQLGGLVAQQAALVHKGLQEQRKFLLISSRAKKPDLSGPEMAAYQDLLKPINEALMAVTDLKDKNRPDPMYTQLSTVADGIMVLAWVTVDSRPYKHVEECLGSAQFFGNRVLKEQKDKDPKQVEWVQAFYQLFRDLADYVKQYFPSGITWNPKGSSAQEVAKSLASGPSPPATPAAVAGGPPPPPPPPPPGPPPILDVKAEPAPAAAPGGLGAVFSELNKGESVTKGLRKVEKSEMTHKNPSLRASSTISDRDGSPRGKSPAPGKKPKPESMRVKKPSKKELEGNKWIIENYDKEAQPIEIEASLTQSILISRCNSTTIIVKGKANQVTIENSSRLSLIVDTLVSTVDVVKAQNFALQVMGTIPTVMLDQIDSAQIYFSKESIGTKIFTSKSAGINLNIISGPDEDYKEVPLPSQICSYYDEEKDDLVNEIVAHAG
ncbi:adenylate cyclase associated N terminal-domain-containing protein [Dactylonectria estremocensis]|uniref:Adenylyl cyclase-associated protein n=1 Tax=Dactylonectria estremocensis TaxID=1079267 RepID=A0A9P9IZX5_9HYPO|nr:adenylate cyclase associated N terminal-domain-containing protein [Dactylonectria estremocensis]